MLVVLVCGCPEPKPPAPVIVPPVAAVPDAQMVFADVGIGCSLNGMRFGADGWLYGAQPTMGRVVRVRLDGQTLEVLADGLSSETYGVALDATGAVFALGGKRVARRSEQIAGGRALAPCVRALRSPQAIGASGGRGRPEATEAT
jgi:hypothetical protein